MTSEEIIKELQKEIEQLKIKNEELEERFDELDREHEQMKSTLTELEADIESPY